MTATRLTRGERSALTRSELLDAAERRFFQDGYHGTSLDQIADDAGYTKGAVYSTFRSKAGLFFALFDVMAERRIAELQALMSAHDGDADVLAALARQPVNAANADFVVLAIEFWVHAAHDPVLLHECSARYARLRDGIAQFAPANGALSPQRWAIVTLALSNGLALERLIDPAGVPGDLMAAVQGRLLDAPAG